MESDDSHVVQQDHQADRDDQAADHDAARTPRISQSAAGSASPARIRWIRVEAESLPNSVEGGRSPPHILLPAPLLGPPRHRDLGSRSFARKPSQLIANRGAGFENKLP